MGKPRKQFLMMLFYTVIVMHGRFNMTNVARHMYCSQRTVSRHFRKPTDFMGLNELILDDIQLGECIAAMDATFLPKAGKHTPGLGWFWSGSDSRSLRGLELSVISIVSLPLKTGFTLNAIRTDGGLNEESRMTQYCAQVGDCKDSITKYTSHLVVDGYYSKFDFVEDVLGHGLQIVGKLRWDANMKYLYEGPHEKKRGGRKKYDGKFDSKDLSRLEFVGTLEDGKTKVEMYTAVLYHMSLKRKIRVVVLKPEGKRKPVLLYSTDLVLTAEKILEYYTSRFQIEFIFRDAKQHLGLQHCQCRNEDAMDHHYNVSLTAQNMVKADLYHQGFLRPEIPFSMQDYKREATNHFMLQRFTSMLGLDPDFVLNHPNYESIINWGRLA